MPKIINTCRFCGKTFERFPSQQGQYCSLPCRSRHRSTEFMPLKPRRGDTIPCGVCGQDFYRSPGEIRRNRRFCSVPCKSQSELRRVEKQCPVCGEAFTVRLSYASIKYCSKTCEGQARTLRPLERIHNGRPARKTREGYVMVWEPTHPNRSMKGWQYEHRLVAEIALNRYLRTDEQVHHVNGQKGDNRPENLEVMSQRDHARLSSCDYRDQVLRDRSELEEYRRRYGPLPNPED